MVPLEGSAIAACPEEASTLATGPIALSLGSTKTESRVGRHNGNKAAKWCDVGSSAAFGFGAGHFSSLRLDRLRMSTTLRRPIHPARFR
jgi:hypothetical protein